MQKTARDFILYIYYSYMYAIQFYINNKITPVGDQTAF